ncbi:MAG: hypothetical protein GX638_13685 [Crenarchaeota archaeon]|nr:hypothetical protein [Thermoproteota archaeon]
MIHNADDFKCDLLANIDNKWVVARPENYKYESFFQRLKEAWGVLIRKYDVVKFYKQ